MLYTNAAAQSPAPIIPSFSFVTPDQKKFTEKNLPVNKVIFFVFFDAGCEHCQRTLHYIGQHFKIFEKTSMVLVSMNSPVAIIQFLDNFAPLLRSHKQVTVLYDKYYGFITTFKPKKYPGMFLYGANRRLLEYEDSDDGFLRLINTIKKIAN